MSFGGFGKANTLGISELLRVTGVKGGELPEISGGIQPVMVVADFSASYTSEPFEARSFAAQFNAIVPNTKRGTGRVISRGPGGCVVEDLVYTTTCKNAGTGNQGLFFTQILDPANLPAGLVETELTRTDIGGRASSSQVFIGNVPSGTTPLGAGPWSMQPFGVAGAFAIGPVVRNRLFIPPGQTLLFMTDGVAGAVDSHGFLVTYRELPTPIGNP